MASNSSSVSSCDPGLLGPDELAEQVFPGVLALLLEHHAQVADEGLHRGEHALDVLLGHVSRYGDVGPFPELVVVRGGHP